MWHLPLPAVTRWGGWTCKFRARQRFSRFLRPGMSDLTSALSSGPGLLGDSQVSDTPTCILDTSFLKCFLTDPTWGSVWCWITEPLMSTRGDWMTKLYTVLFDIIKKKVFGYQMCWSRRVLYLPLVYPDIQGMRAKRNENDAPYSGMTRWMCLLPPPNGEVAAPALRTESCQSCSLMPDTGELLSICWINKP